jgi:hypothetical protein
MTHGPATCIGMVDEALKRPPSQIGKNMPTRPSPAVEIDVIERLTVGVPSPRRTRAAGSGAEALPARSATRRWMPRIGVKSGPL